MVNHLMAFGFLAFWVVGGNWLLNFLSVLGVIVVNLAVAGTSMW